MTDYPICVTSPVTMKQIIPWEKFLNDKGVKTIIKEVPYCLKTRFELWREIVKEDKEYMEQRGMVIINGTFGSPMDKRGREWRARRKNETK